MIIPLPSFSSTASSTPNRISVIPDKKAIGALVNKVLNASGLKQVDVAERMGITKQTLFSYYQGRRVNPSLWWFSRFVEACGGKVYVEFPPR